MSIDFSYPVYVKLFEKKGYQTYFESDLLKPPSSFKEKTEFLQIGGYLPKCLKKILFSRLIDPDDYILCPLYYDENNNPINFQIGVTGNIEPGENEYAASARELGEELGIIPKHIETSYIKKIEDFTSNKPIICFLLPIINSDLLPCKENNKDMVPKIKPPFPYPFKKVGIITFGSQKNILLLFSSSIYRFKSEDTIFGFVAVRSKILRHFSNMIRYSILK